MRVLNVTEVRKQLSQLIKEGELVEIRHPVNTMVMFPKKDLDALEMKLIDLEMQLVINSGQKKYSSEEVEAMLAEVLQDG